ncbi:(2Fe-2S) ferredoxin domain-containing protein [Telmatospirillum sp.]|uniref:(2Fe-2S) ferredoxin domain-containing protein n=1 Tax=Telmatospirillum sp. TaxID=2079197 RepID=UPI002845A633|nr:(2Fe-2S) ferredoxin domain-containing protein [Telmatospirillum sp.]MDR3440149.1 (2Fe-2S) ferredoxin domain-containing protein [Telmatospirillum sp.]
MSYFERHVFFCGNKREAPKQCCADHSAAALCDHMKQLVRQSGLAARGVRVSHAGCLGRCTPGPVLVIYPEGVWYTYTGIDDIEEIFQRHILADEVVTRLSLPGRVESEGLAGRSVVIPQLQGERP